MPSFSWFLSVTNVSLSSANHYIISFSLSLRRSFILMASQSRLSCYRFSYVFLAIVAESLLDARITLFSQSWMACRDISSWFKAPMVDFSRTFSIDSDSKDKQRKTVFYDQWNRKIYRPTQETYLVKKLGEDLLNSAL